VVLSGACVRLAPHTPAQPVLCPCAGTLPLRLPLTLARRLGVPQMTPTEAKQVIEVLARGIDPQTGELLPDDNPLNSPHVIRALFLAAKALELQGGKPAKQPTAKTGNAGKPWTEDEDQQLAQAFDAGQPVAALARTHQRTSGAITARLMRLGRLQLNTNTSK
jgi:hypothetical protein